MNVKSVTFCIICLLFCSSSSATFPSEAHFFSLITEHENIVAIKCMLNIMKKQIPCSTVVTLVYSNDDVNYLVEEINTSECYTVIIRSFNDYNWLIKTSAYVIITENVEELALGMSLITIDSFWNPRARIIVHAQNITYNEINEAFDIFLKYRTYNVVLVTNSDSDDNAEVFTYFPFENGTCGKHFTDANLITFCNDFASIDNFFPNKFNNRMKNCTIKILVNEDMPNIIILPGKNGTGKFVAGVEKHLLKDIAQKEGLNVEYIIADAEEDIGAVLPNHTATGSLASLQNNDADIAAGGFILIQNRANIFEFIYGFNFATYNLYTAALDEPVWKKLYPEFDTPTWVSLLISSCVVTIIVIFFLKLKPEIRNRHPDVILKLWGFFYISNSNGSLLKVTRLRLILTCWIWFTFFISNFYTTALYSLITAYVEPVHHIGSDNLDSLPLKPCVSRRIRELFQYAYNQTLPPNEPSHDCSHTETSLDKVASRTDLYAIEMTYSYDIREYRFIDNEGNRKLDAWSFSADNIIAIHMARGFPLRDKFQTLALKLYEGGFLQYYTEYILHKHKCCVPNQSKIFRNIRLGDLTNHYLILIIGATISTMCLFIEICVQKWKRNCNSEYR